MFVPFIKFGLVALLAFCMLTAAKPLLALDKQGKAEIQTLVAQGQLLCKKNMYDQAEPFFRKALLVDQKRSGAAQPGPSVQTPG